MFCVKIVKDGKAKIFTEDTLEKAKEVAAMQLYRDCEVNIFEIVEEPKFVVIEEYSCEDCHCQDTYDEQSEKIIAVLDEEPSQDFLLAFASKKRKEKVRYVNEKTTVDLFENKIGGYTVIREEEGRWRYSWSYYSEKKLMATQKEVNC